MRDYFLTTARTGLSFWNALDEPEAESLWGDPRVTRYLCAGGAFDRREIHDRLQREIDHQARFGVQYWPFFTLAGGELIGCCGLRPHGTGCYELGFHLRPEYWRQGYAAEAAEAVIDYAFQTLGAESLFAGHHPDNTASRALLKRLDFRYVGDVLYPPTGLYHPSYRRERRPDQATGMILVSECLAGVPCRMDGKDKLVPEIQRLVDAGRAVAVCPEVLGGLPTPRRPSEIRGGRVVNSAGEDVTDAFRKGAEEALRLCREHGCTSAVMKSKSPSCGYRVIHNGQFDGGLAEGSGVLTELLLQEGIPVMTEKEFLQRDP